MTLAEFIRRYPPQPPRRFPTNADEVRLLSTEDGVRFLGAPPAEADIYVAPHSSPEYGRHLWAFRVDDIPYVLETTPNVRSRLASGLAKHTNLTGGQPAACGGELWVDPVRYDLLYVNGASGRYGPETPEQLEDAIRVIEGLGFDVISFGWDDDAGRPARVLR